jgi:solute carrier family 25 phosphate transporter 23/24/25/41
MFQSVDRDRNGILDREELHAAFDRVGLSISASKFEQFFASIDANHDGGINFDEWRYVDVPEILSAHSLNAIGTTSSFCRQTRQP